MFLTTLKVADDYQVGVNGLQYLHAIYDDFVPMCSDRISVGWIKRTAPESHGCSRAYWSGRFVRNFIAHQSIRGLLRGEANIMSPLHKT
jgi:hypothetical protein